MNLVTTPGAVRMRSHPAAGSRLCAPATRTRSPGCGPVMGIGDLIDAGELRLGISKRGLLTGAATDFDLPRVRLLGRAVYACPSADVVASLWGLMTAPGDRRKFRPCGYRRR